MTEQIEREKFEKWALGKWPHLNMEWCDECDAYANGAARNLFEAWQARAREEAVLRTCLGEAFSIIEAIRLGWVWDIAPSVKRRMVKWTSRATRLLGREAAQ